MNERGCIGMEQRVILGDDGSRPALAQLSIMPERKSSRRKPTPSSPHQPVPQGNGRRSQMPTLWVLIVFMLLTNTFYTVFDQQMFPTYYANLFPH